MTRLLRTCCLPQVTAIDSHGSRTVAASTLTVGKCSEPEGNHPPKAGLVGAPYTLQVCNGVGSVTLDAGASSENDPADTIKAFVWEISGQPDLELKLTGPTVTLTAAQGFFAGNVYEVEVFVQDSYGINSWAETNLTGKGGACWCVTLSSPASEWRLLLEQAASLMDLPCFYVFLTFNINFTLCGYQRSHFFFFGFKHVAVAQQASNH